MGREIYKIQRNIYKTVSPFCGKMHKDDAWQNVSALVDLIKSVEGVRDVILGAGVYHNYINKSDKISPAYRDYETIVTTDFGNLYGYIRCHAAGTVQDEFAMYDMTINLYPDKQRDMQERRIVISMSQLNEIMDNQKTSVTFDGDNANELGANAQEKYNDATRTGLKPDSISLNGKTRRNNATDKDETTISFDTNQGNIRDAVTNSVQTAVNNGADINKLNVVGNAEDIQNGMGESKYYTKKQIEEARLYEMRKNGKVMTKKQLMESVDCDELLALISNMTMFKVLEAFKMTFGQDAAEQLMFSRDTNQAICQIYDNADINKQEEFVQRLKGERTDDPEGIDFEIEL